MFFFRTDRFNLSIVGKHFINPCCFGEDLAVWLRERLLARKLNVDQPRQEDWGWYLKFKQEEDSYLIAICGNPDPTSTNKNEGEWMVSVNKTRSIWQRLRGTGKIQHSDQIPELVDGILRSEPGFREFRRDSPAQSPPKREQSN